MGGHRREVGMRDREVKLTAVVAVVFWAAGFTLVSAGIVTEQPGLPGLGVLLGCVGGVLQVRGFCMQVCGHLDDVFEMGREYERGRQDPVRSVR